MQVITPNHSISFSSYLHSRPNAPSVLGIGTPCQDLLYNVKSLGKINSILGNFKRGQLTQNNSWIPIDKYRTFQNIKKLLRKQGLVPSLEAGGSGSNTIKALALLENSTAFLGKLGDHAANTCYKTMIQGLNILFFTPPSQAPCTQVMSFITPDAQRYFVAHQMLSHNLDLNLLSPEVFKGVKVVHFEGYALKEFKFEFIEKAAKLAKEAGATVSFDLGAPFMVECFKENILTLLKHVDVVFANESEVEALAGGVKTLSDHCATVVLLKGKEGATVFSKEEGEISVPAIEATAVDTTGAGDFFAGGFLHGFKEGLSLEQCAQLGNLMGGTVVQYQGAQIPEEVLPSLRERATEICNQKLVAV